MGTKNPTISNQNKSDSISPLAIHGGNYWRFGFGTRLYDLLTPEAYHESARRCIQSIPIKKGQVLLDAGCGSGILLDHLE